MLDFENVETRDGRKVRILCTDYEGNSPIIGIISGPNCEYLVRWQKSGCFSACTNPPKHPSDLVPKGEKQEGLKRSTFGKLRDGTKFATVANDMLAIWRKVHDNVISTDPQDEWVSPLSNAISDAGFGATFANDSIVLLVNNGDPHWESHD